MSLAHQDQMSALRLLKDRPKAMTKNWYFLPYKSAQVTAQVKWLERVVGLVMSRELKGTDAIEFVKAAGVPGFDTTFD